MLQRFCKTLPIDRLLLSFSCKDIQLLQFADLEMQFYKLVEDVVSSDLVLSSNQVQKLGEVAGSNTAPHCHTQVTLLHSANSCIASFPGSLCVWTKSSVLQGTESWVGLGNEHASFLYCWWSHYHWVSLIPTPHPHFIWCIYNTILKAIHSRAGFGSGIETAHYSV